MHIRSQIRKRVIDLLAADLPPTYDVFGSRYFKRNRQPGRALVEVRASNDQTNQREVMGQARIHTLSLYVRVQRSADEDGLDDALDADELLIANSIYGASWGDLLEEDPELLQVNFAEDANTGEPLGAIILRFDMEYRISKTDPETPID